MKVSVIIPTWNERLWLPRLLSRLRRIPEVGEVIVADNDSADGTADLAARYGCKVIRGGRPGAARNRGAAAARGDILLFIDADTLISQETVRRVRRLFLPRRTVAAHFLLQPITSSVFCRLCYGLMNCYFRLLSLAGRAQGVGSFMAVRKSAFDAVGGFNESLTVAEDVDLFQRLRAQGRVTFDPKHKVLVSARRFVLENPLWFAVKCALWAAVRLSGSKRSVFDYLWRPYPESIAEQESLLLPDAAAESRESESRPLAAA